MLMGDIRDSSGATWQGIMTFTAGADTATITLSDADNPPGESNDTLIAPKMEVKAEPLFVATPDASGDDYTYGYSGLTPGKTYEVLATWLAGSSNASAATYSVTSETGSPSGTVDQQSDPEGDAYDSAGGKWQRIVTFTASVSTATVTLSGSGGVLFDYSLEIEEPRPKTSYTYDTAGDVLTETDPLGNVTTNTYDALGRLTSTALPDGSTTSFSYDLVGNLISTTPPSPTGSGYVTTTNTYDQQNNLESTTDANGDVTTFAHNAIGETLSLTDSDGNTTSWGVDHLGETISQSSLVALGYFPDGTVETTLATSYDFHDAAGNLTATIDSDGRSISRVYDDLNRETGETWRDASGAQTGTVAYAYNALGQLQSAGNTVGAGATSVAAYTFWNDLANRPLTEKVELAGLSENVAFERTYDYKGNVATLSANIGGTVNSDTGAVTSGRIEFVNTSQYNSLGDMTSLAQTGQPTGTYNDVTAKYVALGYDADGRLTSLDTYQNPDDSTNLVAHAAYAYNTNSELTDLTYNTATDNSGTVLAGYHWDYNGPGVVGDMYSHNDSDATTPEASYTGSGSNWAKSAFTYDPTGQLVGTTYTQFSTVQTPPDDFSPSYDPNGNRTDVTPATGTATTTGADNRLLFDGTYFYTYDAAGNRTAKFQSTSKVFNASATDITIYTWDNANELVTATHFADWSHYHSDPDPDFFVSYQYDPFGRMVERYAMGADESGAEENFVYDGANIVLALADSGNVVKRNLTGPAADQVLASESPLPFGEDDGEAIGPGGGQAAGPVNWLLTDNQGTVRDVAQFDGTSTTVADHLVYDAFGQVMSQSSSDPANRSTFGYDGSWLDQQTKLNKMGQRWYDARDAVFASYDPAGFGGGQTNLSEFVGNSPTNFTDPSGMYPDGYPDRNTPASSGQGVGDGDGYNCPCCTQAYGIRAGGLDLPEDFDAGGPFEGDGVGTVVVFAGGGGGGGGNNNRGSSDPTLLEQYWRYINPLNSPKSVDGWDTATRVGQGAGWVVAAVAGTALGITEAAAAGGGAATGVTVVTGGVAAAESPVGQEMMAEAGPVASEAGVAIEQEGQVLWDELHPLIEGNVDPNRTQLHEIVQQSGAEIFQESGDYCRVAMNTPLSKFSGLEHSPDIQADVMGLRPGGAIDLMEVVSPSQSVNQLTNKLLEARQQLPPDVQGSILVYDPVTKSYFLSR